MSEQQSETSSDCIISPLPQLEPEDDEYTDMAQEEEMNQSESSSRIESELQSGDVVETRVPREVLKRKGFSNFSIDFLLSKSPTPKVPKILIADNVVGHTDAKIAPFVCERCSETFKANRCFIEHSNKKHLKQISKLWQPCAGCPLLFPSKKSLREHSCGTLTRSSPKASLDLSQVSALFDRSQ